ncbi:uncharacterized protein LOC111629910 isoform X2 [Centruroides sculpturatus]|uniref:uncharacterized protein LOC111629910 isoform X2 n=1 Tax=Centruroides sculpturatus TaxID=218467 RepID=UPI000C6EA1C3|nr:uncharacterized protein LOC111629910 isoform X2 [Centruroides sculpturatus]
MKWSRSLFVVVIIAFVCICYFFFLEETTLDVPVPSNLKQNEAFIVKELISYGRDLIPQVDIFICNVSKGSIFLNNGFWQRCQKSQIYLYSAFYDTRYKYKDVNYPQVRIIGMTEGILQVSLYCLLWKDNVAYSVPAETKEIWLKNWDVVADTIFYRPYIISCPLPYNIKDIDGVSVITTSCEEPTVYFNLSRKVQTEKKNFAVCVKGMDFKNDISLRLIEWIEMQFLLGKDPNDVEKRTKFLNKNIWQKRRHELIPYNDCFYRHIHSHKFVLLLDLDEIIVPTRDLNWHQMIKRIFNDQPDALLNYCSLSARNVYFFDQFTGDSNSYKDIKIPPYMHMLKHIYRSANFSKLGFAVKSFISTNNTLAVFNHYALIPLYPRLRRNGLINKDVARLHHYRSECPLSMKIDCQKIYLKYRVKDTLIWKYAPILTRKVETTVNKLNFNVSNANALKSN